MSVFCFDCLLGGEVTLDCEIVTRFGCADGDTLSVKYKGRPFNTSGLLVDHEDDIIPLSEYLTGFADLKYREAVENARAVNAIAFKQHRKDH